MVSLICVSQNQEERCYRFNHYNTSIIDIHKFVLSAEERVAQHCDVYNIECNFAERTCKRLFYNFAVLEIYNFLKAAKERVIFYLNVNEINSNYLDLVLKLVKVLPITTITHEIGIDVFADRIINMYSEEVSRAEKLLKTQRKTSTCINKFNNFLKKEGLIYLDSTFFRDITNKVLLWNK
jgi:hypothetical protein